MEEKQAAPATPENNHQNTTAPLETPITSSEQPSLPAAPGDVATDILPLGPVVLAIATGAQLMIWLWRAFWHRNISEAQWERYTSLARPMFQADYDKPIYLGGAALVTILAVIVYRLWRIRWESAADEDERRLVRVSAWLHFPAAAAVVLLPMLWIDGLSLNFITALLGFAILILLHAVARRSLDIPPVRPRLPAVWPWGAGVWTTLGLLIAVLYIPHPEFVSGFNYQLEHFAHWNSFAMVPALAYRHGGALNSDYYVQYGVGWPLVLAGLSRFTPLSYGLAIRVAMIWGCVYYGALFFFLQTLLRRTSWAFVGLSLALFLQCFGGMVGSHVWALPSGTVLRYSVNMLFFLACLYHARSGRAWLGLPIGALAGTVLLFGTDPGLYITVCLLFYIAAIPRLQSRAVGWRGWWRFTLGAAAALAGTAGTGLCIAARGTLFQAKFWSVWLESVGDYFAGGISDLPIAWTMNNWCSYLVLVLVLISYLVAILWMFERLWFRKAAAEDLIAGLVALYGMATLLLFVGRSDPAYLRNVAIPFCVVATWLLRAVHQFATEQVLAAVVPERRSAVRGVLQGAPWLVAAALLLALFGDPNFRAYPGLLQTYLGNRSTGPGTMYPWSAAEEDYLFLSRRDAPLSAVPDQENGTRDAEVKRLREEVKNFRAVAEAMRDLAASGKTVAMLDVDDSLYLLEADIRPWFRYSPVLQNLLTKEQVRSVEQVLIDHPPDYVLYPAESPLNTIFHIKADDIYLDIRKVIREHFVLERRIGGTEFYRRKENAQW